MYDDNYDDPGRPPGNWTYLYKNHIRDYKKKDYRAVLYVVACFLPWIALFIWAIAGK